MMLLLVAAMLGLARPAAAGLLFQRPLFSSGMILQRGAGTRIWGTTNATAAVTVTVTDGSTGAVLASVKSAGPSGGKWMVTVAAGVDATMNSTVTATDGVAVDSLADVAWGDVLLCGGQSNMGFGMCGATVIATGPHPQTPTEAMAALPTDNPIRFFNQHGDFNGGAGSTVKGNVCKDPATTSNNGFERWFKAGATNSGAASAVCLLTAQALHSALGGGVPVGAVESCVGGTPVAEWTPPLGILYRQHITPVGNFSPWCAQVCAGVRGCARVCAGMHWCVWVKGCQHFSLWYTLVCAGVRGCALVCTGVCG